jgi:hypothetical protein
VMLFTEPNAAGVPQLVVHPVGGGTDVAVVGDDEPPQPTRTNRSINNKSKSIAFVTRIDFMMRFSGSRRSSKPALIRLYLRVQITREVTAGQISYR